jgi:hypothetical protein
MLTPEQVAKIKDANLRNLVKKAADGKTLTKAELAQLDSAAEIKEQPLKATELAKKLGITRKTFYELRKEGGPKENLLSAWKAFLEERAMTTRDGKSDIHLSEELQTIKRRLLTAQAGKEEAVRKLKELQLQRERDGLVPMSEAREAINRTLQPLRQLLDALPRAAALAANPTEPAHAEEAIREELDKVYRMIQEGENEQDA